MTDTLRIPDDIAFKAIDPKAYADESVHEAFRWLRANQPLGRAELEGVEPFWLVTRHADILEISRQNDLFHSGDRPTTFTTKEAEAAVRKMTGGSPHLVRTLVQMDAPDHPKYRVMTQSWFLPQNIRKLEDRIRQIAREHVDHMAQLGGECDFVNEIALFYPLRVIMEILGVPPEDEPRMLRLTQELFGAQDPELNRQRQEMMDVPDAMEMMQGVIADFFMYFKGITDARKADPKGDVASVIANAQIDGAPINDFEAMSYYVIVATAGHDTTSSSTAAAIWGLAANPGEFAKVKADSSLIPGLVDESIRWMTPVKHFMRSATDDAEIGGRKIAKGDWLWLAYPSGNRDEEVFSDPDAFKVDRKEGKHLAFGYGAHLCLGQHLAKMEMRILFEELLPRLKTLELNGEPKLAQANFVGGPKTLPIKYEMV
ncbi:MAG: cytochrome [Caulobacter sp.]|jgi:cytochrome P450|nr:cytochrome [Caulobacter sp.]